MNLRCKAYEFIIKETVPSDRNLGIQFPESWYHLKRNSGTVAPERRFRIARNTQLDIQNRARKNIRLYAKQIADTISAKHMIVAQKDIDRALSDLEKKFKYYRLSLFTFSLASLMGIMLSGNFEEGYIDMVKEEIETLSDAYREQFEKGSLYLERLGNAGVETAIVKRIASTGKTFGKLIGSIPVVKEGPVDEFLQEKGELLQNKASEKEMKAISTFSALSNPGTRVFVNKMEDMIQIYNHTSSICVDKQNIYLIA